MKKLFKKIGLLLLLASACNFAFAQGKYADIIFRIDSLANVGLPKSALAEVDKLDALARKNKDAPQIINAVIYHITFQSYIQENAIVGIIDTLKSDIDRSVYPVKPVLQSLLADMYWHYYQENRYNFNQRSRLQKPDHDFTKWDLATIITQTGGLYKLSLADATLEQQTPITVLDGVLTGDKATRYLRPTLYDLLVQRAFDFFLAEEPALTRPRMPFSLNGPAFFGDNKTFANLRIITTDTGSTFYQGIKYLQQATSFHIEHNDAEALADLDLKRLDFLHNKSNVDNKDSLYLQALNGLAKAFAGKPISADALVSIGKFHKQKDSLTTAYAYFDQAVKAYPKSMGGLNAAVLQQQITQKTLSVTVENVNSPGKPFPVLISYKNVNAASVRLFKLSQPQLDQYNVLFSRDRFGRNVKNRPVDSNAAYRYLQNITAIKSYTIALPGSEDYRNHSTEFKIDALPVGNYVLVSSGQVGNDATLLEFSDFKVSGLSYIARETPDNQLEVRAMDRETGEPLKGVHVSINSTVTHFNNGRSNTTTDTTQYGITDAAGRLAVTHTNIYNITCSLVYKTDTLIQKNTFVYGATYNEDQDHQTNLKTIFFTDRQIYRPGQVIYFKGIQLATSNRKSKIVPNQPITVKFEDGNNKTQQELKLKTNDFGTFSGTINIPQNILNGRVTLSTDDGEIELSVEDYKRPTFTSNFPKIKGSFHFNDSVRVKGKVMAFSGYGLSGARVAYHVVRSRNYFSYAGMQALYGSSFSNYNNEPDADIAQDTITTDNQGNFTIKFKAKPGNAIAIKNGLTYSYRISADVTDAAGETHSANTSVNIGKKDLQLNAGIPSYFFAKDTAKIQVGLSTLNGQKLSGKIKIEVYALQAPAHLFKNRLWTKPDKYLLTAAEYAQYLPGYAYKGEDDHSNWPLKQKVITLDDKVDTTGDNIITLNNLNTQVSGLYKVVIHAAAASGETDSLVRFITVAKQPASPPDIKDWVVPVVNSVLPGEKAEFLVGVDGPAHILMEQYHNEKLVSSKWVAVNGQQNFSFPVTKVDDNSTAVQMMMVYQNRVYTSYQKIYINRPDKTLKLRLSTFHNLLQPGQKDQWKMQISGYKGEKDAAEMVASLYDASLNELHPVVSWNKIALDGDNRGANYFVWNNDYFSQQRVSAPIAYNYVNYPLLTRNYETLNLFGYNYYGMLNLNYYNYLGRVKTYKQQVEDVKNGYDITGKVLSGSDNLPLRGVSVSFTGSMLSIILTDNKGYFKIRVPKNGTLVFSFIGHLTETVNTTHSVDLTILLKESDHELHEVSINNAVSNGITITLRGNRSPGYAADTVNYKASMYSVTTVRLNGKDFIGGDIAEAQQNLPADILKSIQIVDDYGDQTVTMRELKTFSGQKFSREQLIQNAQQLITPRTNFAETAFFYPQLHTDSAGQILIDFTIPESLTKWKFRAFAHTKDLKSGYIERDVVTQKQLSITANMPRFLREGDTLIVSARLANLTASAIKGGVKLQLLNAVTMQPVSLLVNPAEAAQDFAMAAASTKAVSFKLAIPAGLDALTYRITAASDNYSDGEENTLPVLPNRMLVTESMPMMVRPGQSQTFTFAKLVNQQSKTLLNKTLTLEYTQNPAWYAVQAIPYMMEFPYECSEQVFSRYYANSLATNLVNKMPVIKKVLDQWKAANSTQLVSNLDKNPELKATLLEETPWLRDAVNETEQKKRIALLFDLNKMSYELKQNLDKLQNRQLPDGGFPWFGGDRSDAYITRYILAGIGQLYHSGAVNLSDTELKGIADKAMAYLDNTMIADAKRAKEQKTYDNRELSATEIHEWYAESYFTGRTRSGEVQLLLDNYLALAEKQWVTNNVYEQGLIALTMLRDKKPDVAQKIIRSLLETAQQNNDLGMYWAKNQLGYYWYQSPVETQSLMIELFTEAGNQPKAVEEMKIWLMRNKQTNNWQTTKATAQACYALLLKGDSLLNGSGTSVIKLNGQPLTDLKPALKADAGTGYFKTTWVDEQVKPGLGKVEIANNGKSISWGAMSWQYTENLDKITPSTTDIQLERKYFIEKQTNTGPVLTAVDTKNIPKTGDVLKVVVYLKSGRDFEYLQLKDMRPAGTEPLDVLSAYKFQDGLYYYQVTKDVATNFFISQLNKGSYVFGYRLRVVQPGNYATGISTIQCMYAPEFNAHSEGSRMVIGK